jgi:GTPase SAR1 family protein
MTRKTEGGLILHNYVIVRPFVEVQSKVTSIDIPFLFRSITRAYYRNSVGVLLIYDTTNYVSFTHVTSWLTDARAQIEPYQSVFLLVGTKIDRESERQVCF